MKSKQLFCLLFTVAICGFIACSDDELVISDEMLHEDVYEGPMTRAEAIELILSQGIGYGYNGVEGEFCNVMDVRSQVLNPEGIRNAGIEITMAKVQSPHVEYSAKMGYSLHELIQNLYFGVGVNAEASVVFKGSVRGTLQLYTKSKTSSFYCHTSARISGFNAWVDAPSVGAEVNKYPEVLTKNFRSAVARLGKEPTKMQMDSLIKQYGTHVVTRCQMGGRLDLDIRLEKDSIGTLEQQNAVAEVSLLSLYDHSNLSENDYRDLKIINSGDSHLTVRGGDTRELDFSVFNFKWGENNAKMDAIGKWMGTIGITEDQQQYLELIDMQMTPIWRFVPNKQVAKMLEAHILGTADVLLDIYGYQNFVNTAFPIPTLNAYQGQMIMDNRVKNIYNILAGGRYVATYCREWVEAIDINEPVWVAYPIYNQQVNTSTGLCIHNGKAYRVGWRFGEYLVEEIGETDSRMVYMSMGYLYPEPTDGLDYLESRLCIGYEWPSSIDKDGKLNTNQPIYLPYKQNDDFYLLAMDGTEQTGELKGLPNWKFDGKRMVRSKDYYYYCNLKEIKYVENNTEVEEYIDLRGLTGDIVITKDATVSHATSHKITVADGVTLTLDNANINNQVKCEGNATIVLADRSVNSITAQNAPGIEAGGEGTTLTIDGTGNGSLAVKSSNAAGIGSGNNANCGSIVINGGEISSIGGIGGAGIGCGEGGSCEAVEIFNGIIKAVGGDGGGAGIGSGKDARCINIDIKGGKILARGLQGGAGIGGGKSGSCDSVCISKGVEEIFAIGDSEVKAIDNGNSLFNELIIESGANVRMLEYVDLNRLIKDITLTKHSYLSGTTPYKVNVEDGVDVILASAHINNQLCCFGNVSVWLEDGTTNSVICDEENKAAIMAGYYGLFEDGTSSSFIYSINSEENPSGILKCWGTLKIKGYRGTLIVESKAAGIGASSERIGGYVFIEGGIISVVAKGKGCAGIGTGNRSMINDIVISGGQLNVVGGEEASAIGSGLEGACGNITVEGGRLVASGGEKAAGIGAGCNNGYCGNITITGGSVRAVGLDGGAGIGSSCDSSHCGKIVITNSVDEVVAVAKGCKEAEPIGAGANGSTSDLVTIDKDANVKVYHE